MRSDAKREEELAPWKLGGLTVGELGKRVYREAWEDEIVDRAAGLAYYFLFALFPALLFLTSLLGMLPVPDLMDKLMAYVQQALPGDAASMIRKTLAEIVGGANGGLLSVGAIVALWSASAGVASMMTALNIAYDVEEARPWWKRRLVAIALTVALATLILSAMVLLVFGGAIGRAIDGFLGLGSLVGTVWNVAQWPVAALFVMTAIAVLYYAAPNVEHRRWYWVTPGSVVALVAWLAISVALRLYVTYVGDYNATYGSIGGVILLILWLYLTGLAMLLGAEVNAEIEHAAAARGAPTAKAKGEEAPGKAGAVPRHHGAAGQARAHAGAAVLDEAVEDARLQDLGPVAHRVTEGVATAATGAVAGTFYGLRALPWVVAWGGLRLVAGAARRLAGRRADAAATLHDSEQAAAATARDRLDRARRSELRQAG
jgi:membrane protein